MIQIARIVKCTRWNKRTTPRLGIMLHFDGSASDTGAWKWFSHPECNVSYNYLVLDSGDIVSIAPRDARAWHAGRCKPSGSLDYSDANSAFYGVAAATNEKTPVTPAQLDSIVNLCKYLYEHHGWKRSETHRIVGHDTEAWPRGRKIDPTGTDKSNPILSVEDVRAKVAA